MWIAVLTAVAVQSCHPVDGDLILMRDLALVDDRFASAPAEQAAGFAPQPGAKRVFWPGELIRLAGRNGIDTASPFQQVCFELITHALTVEEVTAAVRKWAPEPARIEVLERSQFPAPTGTLIFDRPQTAQEGKDGAMLLHGYVLRGGKQRFPVWARVRVRVKLILVVAAREMNPGTEVRLADLRTEERETGIKVGGFAAAPADLVGRLAKARITVDTPLLLSQFETGNDVVRGSTVKVEVRDGAARVAFDARAETNGRVGDLISVMNPATSKVFRAKITGKNSVLVSPGVEPRDLAEVTHQ